MAVATSRNPRQDRDHDRARAVPAHQGHGRQVRRLRRRRRRRRRAPAAPARQPPAAEEQTEFTVMLTVVRREQGQRDQGRARADGPRPEGSQGPGRRRAEGRSRKASQGGCGSGQEEARRSRRERLKSSNTRALTRPAVGATRRAFESRSGCGREAKLDFDRRRVIFASLLNRLQETGLVGRRCNRRRCPPAAGSGQPPTPGNATFPDSR